MSQRRARRTTRRITPPDAAHGVPQGDREVPYLCLVVPVGYTATETYRGEAPLQFIGGLASSPAAAAAGVEQEYPEHLIIVLPPALVQRTLDGFRAVLAERGIAWPTEPSS